MGAMKGANGGGEPSGDVPFEISINIGILRPPAQMATVTWTVTIGDGEISRHTIQQRANITMEYMWMEYWEMAFLDAEGMITQNQHNFIYGLMGIGLTDGFSLGLNEFDGWTGRGTALFQTQRQHSWQVGLLLGC